jgi:hypothetical protein
MHDVCWISEQVLKTANEGVGTIKSQPLIFMTGTITVPLPSGSLPVVYLLFWGFHTPCICIRCIRCIRAMASRCTVS